VGWREQGAASAEDRQWRTEAKTKTVTLSAGVLLALLVLAPGFAFYLSLFGHNASERCRVEFESPNAIVPTAFIGLGAVIGHGLWAIVCIGNEWWTGAGLLSFSALSNNTIYELVGCVGAGRSATASLHCLEALDNGEREVLTLLSSIVAIVFLTLAASRGLRWLARDQLDQLKYGWVANIMKEARVSGRYVAAFVLSNVESDGTFLGYQGRVDALNLDARKEISSISILLVGRYVVTPSKRGVRSISVKRRLIPHLHIDRANIRNVALFVPPGVERDVTPDDPQLAEAKEKLQIEPEGGQPG
jgi:hypothetical protein